MRLVFNGVFIALLLLLVGFAIWCGVIVRSVSTLRVDLSSNVELLIVVEDARAALETGEAPEYEAVAAALDRLESRPRLESRVSAARASLVVLESGDPAGLAPLKSTLLEVTRSLRGQSAAIAAELGGYWDALYALVVASLLLLASNMGMLLWARDRDLRLETIQARLVKLATRRFSETSLTTSSTGEPAEATSQHPRDPTVLADPDSELPPKLQ